MEINRDLLRVLCALDTHTYAVAFINREDEMVGNVTGSLADVLGGTLPGDTILDVKRS